ncbi:hypothetical protein, conserved, partial [Babesia bigemina]|jgi:hypothetical protein
MAFL